MMQNKCCSIELCIDVGNNSKQPFLHRILDSKVFDHLGDAE